MVRVGLPGWRPAVADRLVRAAWDLEAAAADPVWVLAVRAAGGPVAAVPEGRAVLQWAAIPGWECEAVDAADRTGKVVQTRWRSGTGGATRARCTTGTHPSVWTIPYGMREVSR